MMRIARRLVLLSMMLAATAAAAAQVPDSVVVADTLAAAAPPAPARPAPPDSVVGFFRDHRGVAQRPLDPARSTALHPSEWLAQLPHGFTFSFRTPGWPDGWSPLGFDPLAVGLLRDGYERTNLTTGRAGFEMLPFGLIESPRIASGTGAGALAVVTNSASFDQARPITGLRYQTDNLGLQHVEAFHSQRRLATIFGRTGEVNVTGAYLGRGASGEYPGSRLRLERGLYGRVRFARPAWSMQLSNYYGRHEIGAHGGVEPWSPQAYETIFVRSDAVVRNAGARRFTIRNDLDATFRMRTDLGMTDVVAYWSAESFRYVHQEATPSRLHRTGASVRQSFSAGRHSIRIHGEGWTEHVEDDSAFVVRDGLGRQAARFSITDSISVGRFDLLAGAGFRTSTDGTHPTAHLRVMRRGTVRPVVEASLTSIDPPRIARHGFGQYVLPSPAIAPARAATLRAGVQLEAAAIDAELSAYAASEHGRILPIYAGGDEPLRFVRAPSRADRFGLYGRFGIRARAERGVYLDADANYIGWMSTPNAPGFAPMPETQPALWGSARVGARMLLFQGDLDADVFARGRWWTGMRSRLLHAPTGILAVPPADARWFDPSGYLDLVLEGQVRTATIFVAYENVLSGTDITLGNLLIPDYPLPERRFRLGVFWPILD